MWQQLNTGINHLSARNTATAQHSKGFDKSTNMAAGHHGQGKAEKTSPKAAAARARTAVFGAISSEGEAPEFLKTSRLVRGRLKQWAPKPQCARARTAVFGAVSFEGEVFFAPNPNIVSQTRTQTFSFFSVCS